MYQWYAPLSSKYHFYELLQIDFKHPWKTIVIGRSSCPHYFLEKPCKSFVHLIKPLPWSTCQQFLLDLFDSCLYCLCWLCVMDWPCVSLFNLDWIACVLTISGHGLFFRNWNIESPIYEGFLVVGASDERYFYPAWERGILCGLVHLYHRHFAIVIFRHVVCQMNYHSSFFLYTSSLFADVCIT
jgi:hypothetical protein